MTSADNEIVHLFDFLRCEPTANRLDNELVVVLAVETDVDTVLRDTLFQLLVVVVDSGVLPGLNIFEDNKPVFAEDLNVIYN